MPKSTVVPFITTYRLPLLMVRPLRAVPFSGVGELPVAGALDGVADADRLGTGPDDCVGVPAAAVGEALGVPVVGAADCVEDGDGVETALGEAELAAVEVVDGPQEVSSRAVPVVTATVRLTAAAWRRARADMTVPPEEL
ncbi:MULTISPECIES: hypothetical protein [unclassified Kitasatospora]|uniref:hypothetical protein n=1 Tax=unclassified Kitasatospora TaxID=2633591 RepID=UPI002474AE28|nr:hypothetical protein [Kitasatospora sp. GAS204B]